MAQSSGTLNLIIHDSNGIPQCVKLQSCQPAKTIKTIPQETMKVLLQSSKAQVVTATNAGQVLRLSSMGSQQKQSVTIPVQSTFRAKVKEERSPSSSPKSNSSPSIVVHGNSTKQSYVTVVDSSSNSSKKRSEMENDSDFYSPPPVSSSKRRKTEKGGMGLRHFSMKVCEKVRNKGTTSYNEVADELVAEFTNPNLLPNSVDQLYDQKNIRRRVYDALNVLMAMNIISKEKKEIRWLGLPTSTAQECVSLLNEKKDIADRIKRKTQQLNELLLKQISLRSLIQRNYELEKSRGPPLPNTAMHLPFIVVNSDKKTVIDCSITNDKTEYQFVFNGKFEINDDIEVLKFIGLTYGLEKGNISEANLEKVKNMLPKSLEKYVMKMAKEPMVETGFDMVDYGAGPSSDVSYGQEEDSHSHLESTSDEESMTSLDLDIN